jgi:TonB-linked SusC/RagA family outer membrane protein
MESKRLRHLAICIIAMTMGLCVQAQQKTVSGKVTDADNRPLSGVTVSVKNTNTKTTTNESGTYSIAAASGNVLVFSFVGYENMESRVGSGSSVNTSLKSIATDLNEVVVVGYGTQRKKDVTGSVVTIKTENLPRAASVSINNMLQGKAAGLNVSLQSAQPGGRLNVNIRGGGAPLYVIDGVPIFNNRAAEPAIVSFGSTVETGFSGGIDRDPLSTLNPNDVESVEILKDASAAAIYGSAAANGVVLITTKRGKMDGKVTTEYEGSYTVLTPKNYFDMLNAKEFMQQQVRIASDKFRYDNNLPPYGTSTATPVFTPLFTQAQIDAAGEGTDWLGEVMRDGHIQQHNISLSGGTDRTRIFSSFNVYDNIAAVQNSDLKRFTGRVNFEQKLSERFKLGMNMTFSQVNSNNASTGAGGQSEKYNSLQAAYAYSPTIGIYDNAGKFTKTLNTLITNPVAFSVMSDKLRTNRMFVSPNLEVKILDNLRLNIVGLADKTTSDRKFFLPVKAQNYLFPEGFAQSSTQQVANYSAEAYATYTKTFGVHNLNIVGGGGYYKSFSENTSMQGVGFFTDALGYNNLGLATNRDKTLIMSFRSVDVVKISQLLRVNYSYKSKYVFTFNMRHDGSSSFAENKKWGLFTGGSAAWRVIEEPFMAGNRIFSDLKLRIGYGEVGNDNGINALALYSNGGGNFLIGTTFYPSVALSQLANPDLTWETTANTNVALEFGLLKGRITGVVEAFRIDRKDILSTVPLPANNAVNVLNVNLGSQRRQGFELSLNTINTQGPLRWETSFNISTYNNKWTKRSPYTALQPYQNAGDRTDVVYGWRTTGLIRTVADKTPSMPNGRLGNIIYRDNNGDNTLNVNDVVLLGYTDPKWILGLGNRFTYKGFDLNIFIYGRLKQYMNNNLTGYFAAARIAGTDAQNVLANVKNVYTTDNQTGALYPGIASNPYDGANPSGTNDFYRENVNFLRLQNIGIGYAYQPKKLVSRVRFFVEMQNVAIWTNYKGYDPEISEANPYPQTLGTSFGLNVTF